jgi:ribosomal protein S18 acetylase RimI-like enzyme
MIRGARNQRQGKGVERRRGEEEAAVLVRVLTEEDGEALWTLRLRALAGNPEAFGTTYDEAIEWGSVSTLRRLRDSNDERFFLGAFIEDSLGGMVRFEREHGTKDRHKGGITSMYVAPEMRGRGVGKALMEEVIARARRLEELEQVRLGVVTTNTAAVALYQALGFTVYGTDPRTLKLGDRYWDEHLMVLDLH